MTLEERTALESLVMNSKTGQIATEVAANLLEASLDNLEAWLAKDLPLDEWIAKSRVGVANMRADLLHPS